MTTNFTLPSDYNPKSRFLELYPTEDFVEIMLIEEAEAQQAIRAPCVIRALARAIDQSAAYIKRGGRFFYVAAGTPYRLAHADASECMVTFRVPENTMIPIGAGGAEALTRPIEGAEDDIEAPIIALEKHKVGPYDVVCGITASGTTPFTRAALRYAQENIGCLTICIVCKKGIRNDDGSPLADIVIEIDTGPEIMYGSTRLKAGTVQKQILNILSTGIWKTLGKTHDGFMVDMRVTNRKLLERALFFIQIFTKLTRNSALSLLERSENWVKLAIVMHHTKVSREEAKERLEACEGHLRRVIGTIEWWKMKN